MLIDVKVPVLSESVAEATLVSWHKKQGEKVNRGENLIDVETDKVVLELPAPNTGVLTKITMGDGATVTSEQIIATIDTEAVGSSETVQVPNKDQTTEKVNKSKETTDDAVNPDETIPMLMPAARKLADENDLKAVEIKKINGTGRGGRVTKEDVQTYVAGKNTTNVVQDVPLESPAEPLIMGERRDRRVAMSRLRMRIAERLVQSQSTAAILTTFNEVNMHSIIDLRARYRKEFEKEYNIKLGFTSFFIKAVIAALKKYPIINASVDGNEIIYHDYYDIGIAVGSPRGLVVPIIRDADCLSLAEIEMQISDFAKRAQDGKLTIEELTGGTFSITNGGVFGSMLSTPIINPPQSAILGIHATKERPVVENGQIVIRPMNYLALSYDHRIIDGREAVLSLVAIKEALEYPMSPLLEA